MSSVVLDESQFPILVLHEEDWGYPSETWKQAGCDHSMGSPAEVMKSFCSLGGTRIDFHTEQLGLV